MPYDRARGYLKSLLRVPILLIDYYIPENNACSLRMLYYPRSMDVTNRNRKYLSKYRVHTLTSNTVRTNKYPLNLI